MAGRIAYYGNIATQGLVLDLDAAIQGSYPKTGSTWFDISNNGNNGTLTNGPLYTGSDYGAIVFDGTDDYVDCGTANIIPNSWTLGGWVNQRRTTGTGMIIARSAGASLYEQNATLGWSSTRSSSYYVAGKLTNGTYYYECTSSVFLNTGSILNIVGTFNEPTTTLTLYINGAPVNTKNTGLSMTTTGPQRIQVGCSDGNTLGNFFSGSIYNTQIYNQSLSQFQVWQNFNAYKSRYGIPDIVTDGLVLNLDAGNPYSYLSGSSGTTWTNTVAASSSISGTLVNGPVYSNGAITFDGTNDYVSLPNNISSSISLTTTLSFWLYRSTVFNSSNIAEVIYFSYTNDSNRGGVYFSEDTGYRGRLSNLIVEAGVITGRVYTQQSSWPAGWYNIVAVRAPSDYKIYVNGVDVPLTIVANSATRAFPISPLYSLIGCDYYSSYGFYSFLKGNLSNVLAYNRILTPTEITQNFNALRGRYGI